MEYCDCRILTTFVETIHKHRDGIDLRPKTSKSKPKDYFDINLIGELFSPNTHNFYTTIW